MLSLPVFFNPAVTIALALVLGMIAQTAAYHLKIPGIVLLLVIGMLAGPDITGLIRPETLGPALNILIGFAVAVILFEGGMNLKFARLKRERKSIRQLIILGGVITISGGAVAARYILDWPWQTAILFGTLVMVTGPTVINPLLKRLKVKRSVATVLEAEGVLIDAIGAVTAIVALEVALSPAHGTPLVWIWHLVSRIGFGMVCGTMAGVALGRVFKVRGLIPEGTENVFTLCMVLALFQGSNEFMPESGIAAVTMAGIVMGNFSTYARQELMEFKEGLTVMLIGMLFVLLAADVRISSILELGWPAVFVVLALIFIVRPLAVFAGTHLSNMAWRERLFMSWIGPRGIVAAAVASLFAVQMSAKGVSGGYELRALVFLVITATVTLAGLTGGLVARLLGLKRPSQEGWVILGANGLARGIARILSESGQEVVCIDSNADHCLAAEADCTRVIYGNGLRARYLRRAEIDTRMGAMAMTPNDEVNYLFMQNVRNETREVSLYCALQSESTSLTRKMIHHEGGKILFGSPVDVEMWALRLKRRQVGLQIWQFAPEKDAEKKAARNQADSKELTIADYSGVKMVFAAFRRGEKVMPVSDVTQISAGDTGYFLVFLTEAESVQNFMESAEWKPVEINDTEYFTTSSCHLTPDKAGL